MAETIQLVTETLDVNDHRRDIAGLRYVYPVVSRRAGGVSLGINLNPNNACNWRCIYCQVPDLVRGNAPAIDLELLQHELHSALQALLHGDFMQRHVPEGVRRFNDIALSGNGEPTTSHEFPDVIRIIAASRASFGLDESVKTVLITNGSQLHKPVIQASLSEMSNLNGEVWYKLDRVPNGTLSVVNQVALTRSAVLRHLIAASQVCRTWVQTCMFELDGWLPSEQEITDYLELVQAAKVAGGKLEGVLLYGLARASTQPEAPRLGRAPEAWMRSLAQRIESLGLAVRLSP